MFFPAESWRKCESLLKIEETPGKPGVFTFSTEKSGEKSPRFFCFGLVQAVALLEAIYASARINQLLAAGIERMALGTNFDLELALDGTALEGLAACAAHDALAVGRMDILLHSFHPS